MKTSELIALLQASFEQNGDLDVINSNEFGFVDLDSSLVTPFKVIENKFHKGKPWNTPYDVAVDDDEPEDVIVKLRIC